MCLCLRIHSILPSTNRLCEIFLGFVQSLFLLPLIGVACAKSRLGQWLVRDPAAEASAKSAVLIKPILIISSFNNRLGLFGGEAEVAHLVEHDLAKVGVAGSSPVFRSGFHLPSSSVASQLRRTRAGGIFFALVVELVDTQDLKSCGQQWPCGFNSRLGHNLKPILMIGFFIR
jgi:hypothetical protein